MSGAGCGLAHLDGAYVLGALAPDERLAFERHLRDCPACARSVQQLAGLPGLLAQVPADVLEPERVEDPPPDTLLPALVREVRRTEHRRRWVVGVAAAAVLAVAGGSVAVVHTLDRADGPGAAATAPPSTGPTRDMRPVAHADVVGRISMTSVPWGTRLDLTCSYESGSHYPDAATATYELVVRSRAGQEQQVATWRGLPGRTMRLTGATALDADDIATVEVREDDGRPVLELDG